MRVAIVLCHGRVECPIDTHRFISDTVDVISLEMSMEIIII